MTTAPERLHLDAAMLQAASPVQGTFCIYAGAEVVGHDLDRLWLPEIKGGMTLSALWLLGTPPPDGEDEPDLAMLELAGVTPAVAASVLSCVGRPRTGIDVALEDDEDDEDDEDVAAARI